MMNNRRFAQILCVLAGVATVAFLVGILFAHHKGEYLGMDDTEQKSIAGIENYINANWAITPTVGSALTWFADDPKTPNPTITPIAPLVRTSTAKWTAVLPQLRYSEVGEADRDDASIIFKPSCGSSQASYDLVERTPTGAVAELSPWHSDDKRNANYWVRVQICVNIASFSSDDDIVSAISHELGHAYGLGDAYNDDLTDDDSGECGDGPSTIMDGSVSFGGKHCDGLTGPSAYDVELVKGLFAKGGVSDFTATNNQDGTATFTWKDNA